MNVIGVACNAGEELLMKEFFEFFKTPWEPYRDGCTYSVVLSTRPGLKHVQAKLLVIYGSTPDENDRQQSSRTGNTYLDYQDVVFPVYGNVLTFASEGPALIRIHEGLDAAAVETADSPMKVIRIGYDLFQELGVLLSTGQPARNALAPTLEIHISMLRDWILSAGIPLVEIPASPAGYEFIACLTHDVDFIRIRDHKFDHTMWGFVYRASVGSLLSLVKGDTSWRAFLRNLKAVVILPAVYLGFCRDFWFDDFERFLSLERDLKATFFFIPFKNRPGDKVPRRHAKRRAAPYDVAEEQPLLQELSRTGNEIGVHGIDAWHDAGKGREEHRRIAETAGNTALGIRMHWLCFDARSPGFLEEAGFQYDSTFGYNETVGYRAGTLQVFRPEGARTLLELPLHLQDTALFYSGHLGLKESGAWKLCEVLLRNAATYGGVLTILWHTRSLAPERLWGDFYFRLLQSLRSRPVWFATAGQVVDWFRNRRAVSFRHIDCAERRVRVVMEYESGASDGVNRPNLTVRIHKPQAQKTAVSRGERSFVDIPWTGEPVMDISVG